MILDPNNLPDKEEAVDRAKDDILHYGIATFQRYIPSSFDGLIPAIRRVMYICYQYKVDTFMKVSKLAGLVVSLHPHGSASIEDTITKMAQDGTVANHALLEPSGNYGNISNLDTAAARYISTRISKFGWDVMVSLMDNHTMEMVDGEDIGEKEPSFVPTKIPLALIMGRAGIAESFTVSIPQHNLNEIADITIRFIRNKKIDTAELSRGLFPDYVVGGTVINGDEIPQHYINHDMDGGVVKVRGDAEIDNANNRIIIRTMPLALDLSSFASRLKDVMNEKDSSGNPKNLVLASITYVGESRDSHTSDPYKYVQCKNGANLVEVLDQLYKCTDLEYSNKINLNMNYNGKIKKSTVKDIVKDWYEANYIIRRRRLIYEINNLENKIHILHGLVKVYPNIDAVIQLIKTSTDTKDATIMRMKNKFDLTLIQARGIYEMRLGDLTRRSEGELLKKIDDMRADITIASNNLSRIDDMMVEDIIDIKRKYGRPRRTKVISKLKERSDIIISNGAILATRNGVGLFDSSNIISGKKILNGLKAVKLNGVWVKSIVNSHKIDDNIEAIAVFYESGTTNGTANLINPTSSINCWIPNNWEENGFITAVCPVYKNVKGSVLCMLHDGQLKRFELDTLTTRISNTSTVVLNCLFIPDGSEDDTVILVNESGEYLNIKVSDVPVKGRTSQGVMSSFASGKGVHMALAKNNSHFVILLENTKLGDGYAITQQIDEVKVMSRTNKPKKLYNFPDFKCLGISVVDLNIKDQVGLFISESSTTSLKVANLKNLKVPRKINCKAFDFIAIEVVS